MEKANLITDALSCKAQVESVDEAVGMDSLICRMWRLLLGSSQQEQVFAPMHEVEILDY